MNGKKKIRLIAMLMVIVLMLTGIVPVSAASGVKISKESITIISGQTYQLKVTVNGSSAKASWGSSNTSVATVSQSGLVTGKAAGSAVITAMVNGTSLECLVSVLKKTTSAISRYNVLILDASGSMRGQPDTSQKIAAKRFCSKVLSTSGKNYVAVVAMSNSAKKMCGFTNNYNTLKKYIDAVQINGNTNIENSLAVAGSLLNSVPLSGDNVMKNIVLCSDGLPTVGQQRASGRYNAADHKWYKFANASYTRADLLKKKNYFIYALGFFHSSTGTNLKFGKRLMKDLASKDKYYVIQDSNDLNDVFDDIADAITKTTMNKASLTINSGQTYQLEARVNGVPKTAAWKSSDSSIVYVNKAGKIKGMNAGVATVSATVGGKTVTCKVTVKPTITLNKTKYTLEVGKKLTLKATVKGTTSKVAWKSSNTSIATVSSSGVVTAKKAGTATITATVGGVSAKCVITVIPSKVPSDATSYNGHSYKYFSDALTWTEADAACKKMGGHLVDINSAEEQAFITSHLPEMSSRKNCYWIGLYYDKGWKWTTDRAFSYKHWAAGEPNNHQSKNEAYVHICAKLYTSGNRKNVGEWNDCQNTGAGYANSYFELKNFGYICEWDY